MTLRPTKEIFAESLKNLSAKKSFKKISVQEIAKNSGHFGGKNYE